MVCVVVTNEASRLKEMLGGEVAAEEEVEWSEALSRLPVIDTKNGVGGGGSRK